MVKIDVLGIRTENTSREVFGMGVEHGDGL